MSHFKKHFFVCTTTRPPMAKPSCGQSKSQDIYIKLVEEMEKRNLYGEVSITATACMGPCSTGPTIVVYPEATWYKEVSVSDVEEIAESHMQNGKPVERLTYNWEN